MTPDRMNGREIPGRDNGERPSDQEMFDASVRAVAEDAALPTPEARAQIFEEAIRRIREFSPAEKARICRGLYSVYERHNALTETIADRKRLSRAVFSLGVSSAGAFPKLIDSPVGQGIALVALLGMAEWLWNRADKTRELKAEHAEYESFQRAVDDVLKANRAEIEEYFAQIEDGEQRLSQEV